MWYDLKSADCNVYTLQRLSHLMLFLPRMAVALNGLLLCWCAVKNLISLSLHWAALISTIIGCTSKTCSPYWMALTCFNVCSTRTTSVYRRLQKPTHALWSLWRRLYSATGVGCRTNCSKTTNEQWNRPIKNLSNVLNHQINPSVSWHNPSYVAKTPRYSCNLGHYGNERGIPMNATL